MLLVVDIDVPQENINVKLFLIKRESTALESMKVESMKVESMKI